MVDHDALQGYFSYDFRVESSQQIDPARLQNQYLPVHNTDDFLNDRTGKFGELELGSESL
jgi:hypothetical protein